MAFASSSRTSGSAPGALIGTVPFARKSSSYARVFRQFAHVVTKREGETNSDARSS
jgi:hypothetical protein